MFFVHLIYIVGYYSAFLYSDLRRMKIATQQAGLTVLAFKFSFLFQAEFQEKCIHFIVIEDWMWSFLQKQQSDLQINPRVLILWEFQTLNNQPTKNKWMSHISAKGLAEHQHHPTAPPIILISRLCVLSVGKAMHPWQGWPFTSRTTKGSRIYALYAMPNLLKGAPWRDI